MTIAAEMARLAAIECLAPMAAMEARRGFPTIAGVNIFDSRRIAIDELSEESFTACVSLYTGKTESARRGVGQGNVGRFGRTSLEIVAELAVRASENGVEFTDALVEDDATARIVLAGLCGQIVDTLMQRPEGALFRKAVMAVDSVTYEPFAIPQLGLRWQRTTITMDCAVPDDDFSTGGGLPEPTRSIAAMFPVKSYARKTLEQLATKFPVAPSYPSIETIAFQVKQQGLSGQAGENVAVKPPFAEIEEPT